MPSKNFNKPIQRQEIDNEIHGNAAYRIADYIIKYKWLILAINICVLVVLFFGMAHRGKEFSEHKTYMKHIQNHPLDKDPNHNNPQPIFNADYHVFFKKGNQDLKDYDNLHKIFSKEDNIIIAITAKNGDIFTNDNLRSLKEITDRSWEIPYISRVNGLTNFNYTHIEKENLNPNDDFYSSDNVYIDNLIINDFITDLPYENDKIDLKKKHALEDPVISKVFLNKNADITQITLLANIPENFPEGFVEARTGAEKLISEVLSKNNNLNAKLSGTIMLNSSFEEYAKKDMGSLFPLMMIFIIIVLYISFRSFWGVLLPLLVIITAVLVPVFLFVGCFNFYMTNVTMNVIQILIAAVIGDSIHVLHVFYREIRNGKNKTEAIREAVGSNIIACLITTVTTAIGFYSLLLQNVPPYQVLGLFAGTGTLYAYLASICTLPAILAIFPVANVKVINIENKSLITNLYDKIAHFVILKQTNIRWISFIVAIASVFFVFQIKMDNNPVEYFEKKSEFRTATEYIDSKIIGMNPIELNFNSAKENGVYDPDFLIKIEKFTEFINSHPEFQITYVSSIVDVVKRLNKTMNGDNLAYYKIPVDNSLTIEGDKINARRLISQYMFMYKLSLPQGSDLKNQLSIDDSMTKVTGYMRSVSSVELLKTTGEINSWLEKNMPEVNAKALGVPVMFANMSSIAIPGMMKGLLVSLTLITITMALTFRSLQIGLISMIPNVLPLMILFGIVGYTGYIVNLSVSVVGMITLGIIIDNTIHFVVKYLMVRKQQNMNKNDAINYTIRDVGNPIFFTSFILFVGFGILMFSKFSLNWDIGAFCSFAIVLGLFADIYILPAFLLKFDSIKDEEVMNTVNESEIKQIYEIAN